MAHTYLDNHPQFSSFVHLSSPHPCLTCRMPWLFSYTSYKLSSWISASVSEQEKQSPEVVSRSESAKLPLHEPKSWGHLVSSCSWALLTTASLLGLAGPPVGLEEGLGNSLCGCPESVLVSGVGSGVWLSPCVGLCSLLISDFWRSNCESS